jgi:hypothetical protein
MAARTTLEAWLAATPIVVDLDTWAEAAEQRLQTRHTFGTDAGTYQF